MTRRYLLAAVAFVVVLSAVAAVLLGATGHAGGSSLNRGSDGWLAARLYVEARGTGTALLDRQIDASPVDGALVTVFPWRQELLADGEAAAIARWVERGGTILVAYSGARRDPYERGLLDLLGVNMDDSGPPPPLDPMAWREWADREWSLTPVDAAAAPLRIAALRRVPRAPEAARILYRDPEGRPVAFAFERSRGRVVVLPADALSNGRLARPGHADLLERLRAEIGGHWTFDEYHHGLRAMVGETGRRSQRAFDQFVAQLLLVYVLVLAALVRRFGPAWREAPVTTSPTAEFLASLGALHDRLGHHADAAQALVARARELDRRLALPPSIEDETRTADAARLLAVARVVGRAQARIGGQR